MNYRKEIRDHEFQILDREFRGGVAVGKTTLQDIEAYANASAYTIRL